MEFPRFLAVSSLLLCSFPLLGKEGNVLLDTKSMDTLALPELSDGAPAAGKLVSATPTEYEGTQVYHLLYLPVSWNSEGERLPIIFEYTGNYFPRSGSTGEVKDAALGYGLSGGEFIWVSLPYIKHGGQQNEVTWWGDVGLTVNYAKVNVPRIVSEFHADPNAVILCGFSRGAIGVNFIGLHDDEIASLWTAFISHDHFDGVKAWTKTDWGSPLASYQAGAIERLKRIGGRPYLVSQNRRNYGADIFIGAHLASIDNFTFLYVDTGSVFGIFPNDWAKSPHTDRWPLLPSIHRERAWEWMNRTVGDVK